MSREEYVESLPNAPHFDPCKCRGTSPGWGYDPARDMWVSACCGKPSGLHRIYSPFCYECGTPFTHPVSPLGETAVEFPFCPDCT